VTADNLTDFLGKPRYFFEVAQRTSVPGVATGLAVTAVGGDVLFVEATRMPGQKGLTLTGQLGDVMRESAKIALSYVRANAERLGIDPDFFSHSDIHLHVPAGAVPKDGPTHRAGLDTVILPKRNEKDLDDLPDEVREKMHFILVETVDEVLEAALEPASAAENKNGTEGEEPAPASASEATQPEERS